VCDIQTKVALHRRDTGEGDVIDVDVFAAPGCGMLAANEFVID
jgi:hypothetical protein